MWHFKGNKDSYLLVAYITITSCNLLCSGEDEQRAKRIAAAQALRNEIITTLKQPEFQKLRREAPCDNMIEWHNYIAVEMVNEQAIIASPKFSADVQELALEMLKKFQKLTKLQHKLLQAAAARMTAASEKE